MHRVLIAIQISDMGIARAKTNRKIPSIGMRVNELDAPVDTGSLFLCLPEEVRLQLRLEELKKRK